MPNGKPAGERCVQLKDDNLCRLFGQPSRPKVCLQFRPCADVCGDSSEQAIWRITELEAATSL
ncbi:hypothetical protein GCM10007895_30760 [Paraferrimonas sedimenticola]|uniref:Proteinase inhibitor n=2 Tax=Paraferrimonas sedimenticola TaxID=375674 RepID=A0AA37RZC0_9GAMM|nr:hypothetical protein GCM10007895_30760 [Paraferrimonas sedimenticola]